MYCGHFDITELKVDSSGASEASQTKWTPCLQACPSAEQRAASGIQRDGEMSKTNAAMSEPGKCTVFRQS